MYYKTPKSRHLFFLGAWITTIYIYLIINTFTQYGFQGVCIVLKVVYQKRKPTGMERSNSTRNTINFT